MSLCLKSEIRRVRARVPRPSRRLRVLGVAVVTTVASVLVPGLVQPAGASGKGTYLGIDVAAHQHPGDKPIDWKAVRKFGVRFVFVKATEGAGTPGTASTNPWFAKDWKGAAGAGIVRGAYHYARPRYPLSTAASDAQRFMSLVHQVAPGELAPVLDLEETGGLAPKELAAWVGSWMKAASKSAGRPVTIYTTRGFWTSYLGNTTSFAQYPLWLANHTSAARPVPTPGGWKAWTFWQYSATGTIAGISAPVDLNLSCGWPGSKPSGSKSSICTTTGSTATAASSAGATVKAPATPVKQKAPTTAPKPATSTKSAASTKSPAPPTKTATPSTKSSSTKSTTPSSTKKKTATVPAPRPAAAPAPKPLPVRSRAI